MPAVPREQRRHPWKRDQRSEGQRDRDRVLYCSAFRRLAGVTQVVAPEGHVFHNRLTHTLEAAQIARRLAEKLSKEQHELSDSLGGIDPDVVEAAALIHDLGHPPFGHIAEDELNKLAIDAHDPDGFEGNAQSFRIVTRLVAHKAVREGDSARHAYKGLNLTRATLNASLKYPRFRPSKSTGPGRVKFGAYKSDGDDFAFARDGFRGEQRSIEAEIMDYADDVAYSVHDLDDFYRAGLIPMDRLIHYEQDFTAFLDDWIATGRVTDTEIGEHHDALRDWIEWYIVVPGRRSFAQRALLRMQTATQIDKAIRDVRLQQRDGSGRGLFVPPKGRFVLKFCQRLVWHYVIDNPQLATLQNGQREVVRTLFKAYLDQLLDKKAKTKSLIPPRFDVELAEVKNARDRARIAIDIVSSMSDYQAATVSGRLRGVTPGSFTDLI